MASATCKSQHLAGEYSITVREKGAMRRKGCGSGGTSVGDMRQSRLELISCGTQSWRTVDTEICSV